MNAGISAAILVADIGGTNARFGVACEDPDSGVIIVKHQRQFLCSEFDSATEVFEHYRRELDADWPTLACVGVAGPVVSDVVKFINLDWQIDYSTLKTQFGFDELLLVNDFVTQAYAAVHLPDAQIQCFRAGKPKLSTPRLIVGPGTGLGVAALKPLGNGRWLAIPGEAGHVSFAPSNELEREIHRVLSNELSFVAVEDLISGPGLQRLYQALAKIRGETVRLRSAPEITAEACEHPKGIAFETVNVFLSALGGAAGNAALTLGAFAGVYFAGGILPQIQSLIANSGLISAFENKGPLQPLLSETPLHLITGQTPALVGAAHLLIDQIGLTNTYSR